MSSINTELLRSTGTTFLKAIGSAFRIADIPWSERGLLMATVVREGIVLAGLFGTSVALEMGARMSKLKIAKMPGVSFGIQAASYIVAEAFSRNVTGYKARLTQSLTTQPVASKTSLNLSDGMTNALTSSNALAATNTAFASQKNTLPTPKPMFNTSFQTTPRPVSMLSSSYNPLYSISPFR